MENTKNFTYFFFFQHPHDFAQCIFIDSAHLLLVQRFMSAHCLQNLLLSLQPMQTFKIKEQNSIFTTTIIYIYCMCPIFLHPSMQQCWKISRLSIFWTPGCTTTLVYMIISFTYKHDIDVAAVFKRLVKHKVQTLASGLLLHGSFWSHAAEFNYFYFVSFR